MKFRALPWSLLISTALFFSMMPTIASFVGSAFDSLFPVHSQWRVASTEVDGDDVIISGTMLKNRDCRYIPPPRARTLDGQNLKVTSSSPTAEITWMSDAKPQNFGPWRIHGGARETVIVYQHHQCHFAWDTFTELGRVQAGKQLP